MKRLPLLASFLLFIALCASIAYWALQLFKPPLRPVAAPPRVARMEVAPEAASALFGGRPGKVAAASNFQLKGVIMSGTAGDSVAILGADGKPAQAVRVDMEVAPNVTVKEVHRDYVLLSDGGTIKRVDLPENAKAQVNVVPVPGPPIPVQGPATPPPTTGRGHFTPPSAQTQNAASAPTTNATTGRSPLLPPPAPQAAQQIQPQGQAAQSQPQQHGQVRSGQTVPPTTVVSPPPSSQATQNAAPSATTAQPAGAAAPQQAPVAAAPQPAPNQSYGGATSSNPSQYSGNSGAGSSGGSGGSEMLPPATLRSR